MRKEYITYTIQYNKKEEYIRKEKKNTRLHTRKIKRKKEKKRQQKTGQEGGVTGTDRNKVERNN